MNDTTRVKSTTPPRMSGAEKFTLFADCLLVGVCTAIAAIGVVTAVPAMAAGCTALRERITADRPAGPVAYTRHLRHAMRGSRAVLFAPVLVLTVLAADAIAVAAGVPGQLPLAGLLVVASCGAVVFGLRAAARWRADTGWAVAARSAGVDVVADPTGSLLLLMAVVATVVVGSLVPITLLLVAGPLALAATAIDGHTGRNPFP